MYFIASENQLHISEHNFPISLKSSIGFKTKLFSFFLKKKKGKKSLLSVFAYANQTVEVLHSEMLEMNARVSWHVYCAFQ